MKIIPDMPATLYHAHSAVSKSVLDQINRSPLHCHAYLHGEQPEPTAAMQFGTALHAAVLEPKLFLSQYAVFEGDRRTKDGKARYEELQKCGASIISAADASTIKKMRMSIHLHPIASALLQTGIAEASVFWTDPGTGLECKCRPDWWDQETRTLVDLKTTEDASPEGFARAVAAYRYHVQAAHYMEGTQAARFLFVAIEKKPPYAVAVYELDQASLELGRQARDQNLATYAACASSNEWPGYSADVTPLPLPGWAFPKTEVEEIEVSYV